MTSAEERTSAVGLLAVGPGEPSAVGLLAVGLLAVVLLKGQMSGRMSAMAGGQMAGLVAVVVEGLLAVAVVAEGLLGMQASLRQVTLQVGPPLPRAPVPAAPARLQGRPSRSRSRGRVP